jgi:serine/threonine protein kinase
MIGRKLLHYDVIESLGEGGMGVVYKAVDTRLNRPVALKFISPGRVGDEQNRARLVNEARSAAALRHPNICTVYDIGETPEGETFISMAYLEGTSLRDRILKQGRLPVDETIRIVSQIAEGLREAHARGVIHRDIKSANILLTDRNEAVIPRLRPGEIARHLVGDSDRFLQRHRVVRIARADPRRSRRPPHRPVVAGRGVVRDARRARCRFPATRWRRRCTPCSKPPRRHCDRFAPMFRPASRGSSRACSRRT